MAALRRCNLVRGREKPAADFACTAVSGMPPKRKTRPGGQPDGSSHMGAWGGWALAPNTASMGRDNRSHAHLSPKGRPTFKPPCDFFNFLAGIFGTKNYCAAARLASPAADLSDAMVAAGWSRALVVGASCRSPALSGAGRPDTAATGTAGAVTAETAA